MNKCVISFSFWIFILVSGCRKDIPDPFSDHSGNFGNRVKSMKNEYGTFTYDYNFFYLTKVNDQIIDWEPNEMKLGYYTYQRNLSGYISNFPHSGMVDYFYYNDLNLVDSVYHLSYSNLYFGYSYGIKNEYLNGNLHRSYYKVGQNDSVMIKYEYDLDRINLVDFGLNFWPGFSHGITRFYLNISYLSPDKNVFKRMQEERYKDNKLISGYIEEVVSIDFDIKERITKYIIDKSSFDSLGNKTVIGTKTISLDYFD